MRSRFPCEQLRLPGLVRAHGHVAEHPVEAWRTFVVDAAARNPLQIKRAQALGPLGRTDVTLSCFYRRRPAVLRNRSGRSGALLHMHGRPYCTSCVAAVIAHPSDRGQDSCRDEWSALICWPLVDKDKRLDCILGALASYSVYTCACTCNRDHDGETLQQCEPTDA